MIKRLFLVLLTTSLVTINLENKVKAHHKQIGIASFYGHNDNFHNKRTASGVIFSKWSNICAHNSYKFGTKLKVTNLDNKKSTICNVQDRGDFTKYGRIIDLSYSSFSKIAPVNQGLIKVKIEKVK